MNVDADAGVAADAATTTTTNVNDCVLPITAKSKLIWWERKALVDNGTIMFFELFYICTSIWTKFILMKNGLLRAKSN